MNQKLLFSLETGKHNHYLYFHVAYCIFNVKVGHNLSKSVTELIRNIWECLPANLLKLELQNIWLNSIQLFSLNTLYKNILIFSLNYSGSSNYPQTDCCAVSCILLLHCCACTPYTVRTVSITRFNNSIEDLCIFDII